MHANWLNHPRCSRYANPNVLPLPATSVKALAGLLAAGGLQRLRWRRYRFGGGTPRQRAISFSTAFGAAKGRRIDAGLAMVRAR